VKLLFWLSGFVVGWFVCRWFSRWRRRKRYAQQCMDMVRSAAKDKGNEGERQHLNLLIKADARILLMVERCAGRVQLLTGVDCFHLRDLMHLVCAGLCLEEVAVLLSDKTSPVWLLGFPALAFLVLAWHWGRLGLDGEPNDEIYRQGKFVNSRRLLGPPECYVRLGVFVCAVFVCGVGIGIRMWLPGQVLTLPAALAIYLDCCNPRPPGESKVRKWLRALATRPLGAPSQESA